jgi:hypothetical protein
MDWIAVRVREVMGEACAESDSMDWTAVEFDEVMGRSLC